MSAQLGLMMRDCRFRCRSDGLQILRCRFSKICSIIREKDVTRGSQAVLHRFYTRSTVGVPALICMERSHVCRAPDLPRRAHSRAKRKFAQKLQYLPVLPSFLELHRTLSYVLGRLQNREVATMTRCRPEAVRRGVSSRGTALESC